VAAKRLVEGGVFNRFYPADVAADLAPSISGYEALPRQLVRLIADLAEVDDASSVYCPWEFNGQMIGANLWSKAKVHAESILPFPLPALVSLFREHQTSIIVTDPLTEPSAVINGRLETFEATIAFPPMGIKLDADISGRDLYDRFPIPKATATGLMVQHIAAQTEGLAAILLPNSFLFGPGTDKDVREHFLHKRRVQAVVALPPGILPFGNIPTAILLLNTKQSCNVVRFVDATQSYFRQTISKGRPELCNETDIVDYCLWNEQIYEVELGRVKPLDETLAMSVPIDDVLENDASLQVNRFVMPSERRRVQQLLEAAPSTALEDLAEFVTALPHKDRDGEFNGIEVFEVGAADLPQAGYIKAPARVVSIQLPKRRSGDAKDVFLRPCDVVLIIKGSAGKIGIVPEDAPAPGPGGWIAGQSAVVLRARDLRSDLRALALMLRSRIGQQLLASIQSGASIPMISLAALRRLAVPALPEAMAREAVQVLEREAYLQQQIDDLLREQSQLADSLWDNLLTGVEPT
jgi:type I restriction enzyme M protein